MCLATPQTRITAVFSSHRADKTDEEWSVSI